jgi:hypothetical protein
VTSRRPQEPHPPRQSASPVDVPYVGEISVQQLGSIYERLLEFEPVVDPAAQDGMATEIKADSAR